MRQPVFLTVENVLALHADAIAEFGGAEGTRDPGLLESAVELVRQTFDGTYLAASIPAMAATYWYHLVMNHPFVDGNKRVGLYACESFLF